MYEIEDFRQRNMLGKIAVTKHAKERCEERGIKVDDVTHCISTGEIIKQFEDDKPLPGCLIVGRAVDGKNMHGNKQRRRIYLFDNSLLFRSYSMGNRFND